MMEFYAHETAIVDEGCSIGSGTRIWHFCHIMASAKIGRDCNLGQNVFVGNGVILGDRVKVQNNVSLYSGVHCSDDVFLGPSMVFTNVSRPRSEVNRRDAYEKTFVGRGVTVGANATIVCGTTIGEYAFIGAGAVVTKDVPAFALVVGNPARQTGWVSKAGLRLKFDSGGVAVCPHDGSHYRLHANRVEFLNAQA